MSASVNVNVRYMHPVWSESALTYSTQDSVGLDLRACFDQAALTLKPGRRQAIPAGVAIEILTPGIAGFIFSRSGLGTKEGLVVSQGVGVIDPDYRGEIIVSLRNTSRTERTIDQGQRIAQLLFLPAFQARLFAVDQLSETSRGQGGFGHTGH
ncbi:dUTP diphosphatase [Desulfovermiculus halophilus]|jgi:dUTP pyrophosphatase|uniref:dUTP diphosphatase n=1 Tax=Desulfovermiculus halophilus TaxID=339722 RepID=UPI000484776D|nr:dUTP diphosphatase [Desulfovermiculus halophilus]